jgi:hypothetical protein
MVELVEFFLGDFSPLVFFVLTFQLIVLVD